MKFKEIRWNEDKDAILWANSSRKNVGFSECATEIEEGRILDIVENENYPGQKMYLINLHDYVYVVPFVENDGVVFLKTIFPNRDFTKIYLRQE